MNRSLFRVIVLCVAGSGIITWSASAAAPQPAIDVNPASGNAFGGDETTIYLINGATNACAVNLTCVPAVTFDGVNARVLKSDASSLFVLVPPHDRGDVTLTVYAGATYQTTFHYVTESDYQRVLLPINVPNAPGAFGSLWTSDTEIANSGTEAVDVRLQNCQLIDNPCPRYTRLSPGGAPVRITANRNPDQPGVLFYVPKSALAQIAVNSRVQDLSRQAETWGTELPLVPSDAFSQDVLLLNIPNDPRFRTTLRIYGNTYGPMEVRIRIWPLSSAGAPIVDDTRVLSGYATVVPVFFPIDPAYTAVAIDSYAEVQGQGPLRVDVTAPPGVVPVWAFASVTNNATQHVTVVTPRQ